MDFLTVAVFGALRSKLDVTTAPLVLIILGGDSFLGNVFKLSTNFRVSNTSTFPYSHHISINTIRLSNFTAKQGSIV
jgi:hypothetical protein